jgi:hypothetical protein
MTGTRPSFFFGAIFLREYVGATGELSVVTDLSEAGVEGMVENNVG